MDKNPVIEYGKSDVIRGGRIGGGSFGEVFEGKLKGQRIAIKVPKDKLRDDIMNELLFLAKLKHPNVVHFYGVLQEDDLGINLLFEYLDGDARTFVQSQDRNLETLLGISHDIALGMDYIHDLGIIHRDLAARNVLVDSKNVAKISDFGLSRLIDQNHDHYTITETTIRPWRWIPRECLEIGGKFSKSSDIWSFGVTLWEIWNKAETPYGELSNEHVKQAIDKGKNPMSYEMDEGIPEGIKKLLENIFVEEELRPSFANIKIFLNELRKGKKGLTINKIRNEMIKINERKRVSPKNLSEIEIVQSDYTLNGENVDAILKSAKDNETVKYLECINISTRRVPQILKKFKSIETLKFWHEKSMNGYCFYLDLRSGEKKEEVCMFRMEDLDGYSNLKILHLINLDVSIFRTYPKLPGLKKLFLQSCDIFGDLINDFICVLNLEDLVLYGNTPMLTKDDVEKLLRIKSLKFIGLMKHFREIFATCFTPIGPDGRSMEKITPNSKIVFQRESIEEPWVQTIEFLEIVDGSFNLTSDNVDLVLNSPNENYTVGLLICSNISTRRIPHISKIFKIIKILEFWHYMDEDGKCLIFEPPKKSVLSFFWKLDDCLLKMIDLKGFEKLRELCLENVEVEFPQNFSFAKSLPKLEIFEIIFCSVIGNFMDALTFPSNLEDVRLSGITPFLTKEDVERLLRNNSLNYIELSKGNNREIFSSSFTPIGPDGNQMKEIKQNTNITFQRASFGKSWAQHMSPVEHGEFHLNIRNINSVLNSPFENTTATTLYCSQFPTMNVPAILIKFKSIQKLIFEHLFVKSTYKCAYFGSISAERKDVCLFKMADLGENLNLKELHLLNLDVSFPRTFPNLPELRTLILKHCDISGDLINDFICKSNLEELGLWGITPSLSKEDVEKLLANKSLKLIKLKKYIREIFASSFSPIGPDGNPMQKIIPNADIRFIRESFDIPWDQKVEEIKD